MQENEVEVATLLSAVREVESSMGELKRMLESANRESAYYTAEKIEDQLESILFQVDNILVSLEKGLFPERFLHLEQMEKEELETSHPDFLSQDEIASKIAHYHQIMKGGN